MKNLRISSQSDNEAHWHNSYTLFCESVSLLQKMITVRPSCSKATAVSAEHPVIQTGIRLVCKIYDSPTSSDRAWLNCLSVKLGAGDSARFHMPDEYILLEEIKKGINLYIKLLEALPLQLANGFSTTNQFSLAHN